MSALVAAAEHGPGGAAHIVLLAGIVVIAIAVLGVSRWRTRRDIAAAREATTSRDQPAEGKQSTEDE
jgi:hypothetical protein